MSLIDDSRQYLEGVRSEFRKVTWPTQQEYTSGTIGVLIIVTFLTIILGLTDFVLTEIMELILG